jgi:tripartite-type tricarboxylate transporter receptor subunit TctC
MDRRRFVIGTAATALAAGPAFAQETFPSHAVTIINAFPPGGINDLVTRPLAAAMEPILKQPVVVEAKAGAAGQVGAQFVASAKPDGYTLLSHNTAALPRPAAPTSFRLRAWSRIRCCCWSTSSSLTRR